MLERRALLASFVVQNLNDAGAGSLRDAIEQANLDSALDQIRFAPSLVGTISLATPLPGLSTPMSIIGPGQANLTVEGQGTFLTIPVGGAASISGLTFKGGAQIVNDGTLALTDATIRGKDSSPSLFSGGGLLNTGTLALVGSTIRYTSTGSSSRGGAGAIFNTGTMSIRDSRILENHADGSGGGVRNLGNLSIENSTISGNHAGLAGGQGAGIDNQGRLLVVNTTLSDNTASGTFGSGPGGGISNESEALLQNVIIRGNNGGDRGGGIANFGVLTITDSTVADNLSTSRGYGSGGGIYNDGAISLIATSVEGNDASGSLGVPVGGGIYNTGLLTMRDALVSGNVAKARAGGVAGGIYNSGSMRVLNTTITGNNAVSSDDGILNAGDLSLTFVTISADGSAIPGPAVGLVIIPNFGRLVTATNCIFDTEGGQSVVESVPGAFVSLGHNLFSDQPTVSIDPTDLVNTNPKLSPLADNGGPTMTMALLSSSPAINAGAMIAGVTTDQRGALRPSNGQPDIGAFELQFPPVVLGVDRLGVHREPTALVVRFIQAMDASRAENLDAYRLTTAGADRHFGTADDGVVAIAAARYDPVALTTTLQLACRLPLGGNFRLTIAGTPPNGLTDSQGLLLDGAGNRQPGSDYVARINSWNLKPPIHHSLPRQVRRG